MIIQKINTKIKDKYDLAYKYFFILSVVNDLDLVKRDVQLLSYAISEDKNVSEVKEEFIEKFNTSMATVGNIISKLYRLKILKKHKRVVKIQPVFLIDFNKDLALALVFKHGDKR